MSMNVCISGSYESIYESQMTTAGIVDNTSLAWAGWHRTWELALL